MRIVVTHDPLDAAALADRLVVLEAGRVVQQGTLAEITARPRSRYVADLVGVNLLAGHAVDRRTSTSADSSWSSPTASTATCCSPSNLAPSRSRASRPEGTRPQRVARRDRRRSTAPATAPACV